MGLKATITTLINDKIRNKTPKVIKVEHADVEQAILDNGYITALDNSIAQVYTTKGAGIATVNYSLMFTKSFGMVTVEIEVQQTGFFNIPANTTLLSWKTLYLGLPNEFRCGGSGDIYHANMTHDIHIVPDVFIRVDQTGMTLPQGLSAGAKYYGQITFPSIS